MDPISAHIPQRASKLMLATLKDRIAAFVIDLSLLLLFALGLLVLLRSYAFSESEQLHTFMYMIPVFLAYSLLFESLNHGRSPGKYVMKIRVLRVDGTVGSFMNYATRWLFRVLDVYISMGIFASILVSVTEKNQRLGDLVANTIVVKES